MISAIILTSLTYGVATALKDSESEDRTNSKMPKYLVDVTADLCCITYDECMKTATDLEALFGYKVTDVECQTPEAPTADPTATDPVTAEPTAVPTEGTAVDTMEPTAAPTDVLTAEPTAIPTELVTAEPTAVPTEGLTAEPTAAPTEMLTAEPTAAPIDSVTAEPTAAPTADPTAAPTEVETTEPTEAPPSTPTESPVEAPAPGPASGAITLDWTAGLSEASARTLDAAPGTVITFEWSSGHNVNIMKDEAALNSCSFRGSQRIGGNSGPVTFTVPADAVPGSKIFFACAVGFHCLGGQHLTVTVSGDSSASVPSPSATVTPAPTRGGIFGRRRRLPSADKQAWRVTYTFAVDTLRAKEELAKKAMTNPNDGDNLDKILAALSNRGVETFQTASVMVTEGVTCKWVEGDKNTEDGTYVGNVDMLRSCEDRVRRVCPEATKAYVKEDADGRKMCYCHVGELEIGSDALEGKTCLINKEVELPPITCEDPTFVKTCVDKLVKTGGCILYSEVSSEEEIMAVTKTVFDKVDEKCLACDIVDDAVADKCMRLTKKPRDDDDDGPKLVHIAILAGVALLIGCFVALVLFQPTCCCCKPKRDPVVDHYIKAELSQ